MTAKRGESTPFKKQGTKVSFLRRVASVVVLFFFFTVDVAFPLKAFASTVNVSSQRFSEISKTLPLLMRGVQDAQRLKHPQFYVHHAPDPVNALNGNLFLPYQDLFIPARGFPLEVSRVYNSRGRTKGLFGYGLSSSLETTLKQSGSGAVIIREWDGSKTRDLNYKPYGYEKTIPITELPPALNWTGWNVRQELQERLVRINPDASSETIIREIWMCTASPSEGQPRHSRLVYEFNRDLNVVSLIALKINSKSYTTTGLHMKGQSPVFIEKNTDSKKQFLFSHINAGDRIEIALHIFQRPLIPGQINTTIVLSKSYPIQKSIFQVTVPHNFPVFYKAYNTSIKPEIEIRKNEKTFKWVAEEKHHGFLNSKSLRISHGPPRITVSSSNSWDTIRTWYADKYRSAMLDGFMDVNKLFTLKKMTGDNLSYVLESYQRATKILTKERDENGIYAYIPKTPAQIWASQEADCKDLTILAALFLNKAGWNARPILFTPLSLKDELPNPFIFHHSLLRIEAGNRSELFDPLMGIVRIIENMDDHLLDLLW